MPWFTVYAAVIDKRIRNAWACKTFEDAKAWQESLAAEGWDIQLIINHNHEILFDSRRAANG
jgi:hypothetical protein